MTPSQINALLRQQQQKQKQAVQKYNLEVDRVNRANKAAAEKAARDYNREVDRVNQHNKRVVEDHNREVRTRQQRERAAIAKYNRAVNLHNRQLERDRQQRLTALRSSSSTRYVEVRQSALDLSDQFEHYQQTRAAAPEDEMLRLSEREASNSAAVAEALAADEPQSLEDQQDTGILDVLGEFSHDLRDRWEGAIYALNPKNPDAGRHFCTSVREIFVEILNGWASDKDVTAANPNCERTPKGTPSRRAKIRFLLKQKGADTPEMLGFVEKDIDDILQLFKVFNEATHGTAGKHGLEKLKIIRQRVEGGIMFLAAVAL